MKTTRSAPGRHTTPWRIMAPLALVLLVSGLLAGCGKDNNSTPKVEPPTCTSTCTPTQRKCEDDKNVLSCVEQENGCFAFGAPKACPGIKVCNAGQCVDEIAMCPNACQQGDPPRCNTSGQTEICSDSDNDGCFSYGEALDCPEGDVCNPDSGQCEEVSCTDECTAGQAKCEDSLISRCESSKTGCMVFAPARDCKDGRVCMGGECVMPTSCEDECIEGEKLCGPGEVPRLCEDGNNDGCVELVDQAACSGGEVCRSGACVSGGGCVDECAAGDRICVGNQIAECGDFDNDSCKEFGPDTACPGAETCQVDGSGQAACKAPPMSGAVVINEVFYDTLENSDLKPDGASSTFIELYGPPALSLANYEVRLVNGSNGMVYNTFKLPADAKLDGNGYAILTMALSDLPFFLLLSTNVYDIMTPYSGGTDALQNGPDSITLYDASGTKLDGVGHTKNGGSGFSNMANFAGEGTPVRGAASGRSLGRTSPGKDTNDNAADFVSFFPTPGFANQDLVINEVYYNQPGADGQDGSIETFIELVAPYQGWVDLNLDGYVLRGINGADGKDYLFTDVAPGVVFSSAERLNQIMGRPGFAVICNLEAINAILDLCTIPYVGVDYQNGPDSFVLEYRGRVIDAVGYGSFGATHTFAGEGSAAASASAGQSLGRAPRTDPSRKVDTNDNAADFKKGSPTPAADNDWPTGP